MFLMFSNYFDVLILKIILKTIYYYHVFLSEKHFKNNSNHTSNIPATKTKKKTLSYNTKARQAATPSTDKDNMDMVLIAVKDNLILFYIREPCI